MKKSSPKQSQRTIPTFASEAEEARWWYQNREKHGRELSVAAREGTARALTREALLQRVATVRTASPVVSLRIPATDLELARKQAEAKGLPYQTYIKSLLHETLAARERRKTGQ